MGVKVITICGSMRYSKEMMKISEELELKKAYAVIQCIYNIDGYIGKSTRNEIEYAINNGKEVIYHETINQLNCKEEK